MFFCLKKNRTQSDIFYCPAPILMFPPSGLGLQCFVCNTLQGDTNCEDSFDLPGLPGYLDLNSIAGYSKETDSMKKRIGYLKDCPGYPEAVTNDTANDMAGVTYTPYCRKRKAIIYGKCESRLIITVMHWKLILN